MANTNNPHSFMFEKNLAGAGAPVVQRFVTKSAAAIKVGDPVVFHSGTAAAVGIGKVKLAGVTSTALLGISIEAVTSAAGVRKSVAVIPALPTYVFSGQVKSSTNLTAGYLGKKFGIAGTTNGKLGLSATATTSVAQIVGLKASSAWGTYAELLFVITKSSYTGQA